MRITAETIYLPPRLHRLKPMLHRWCKDRKGSLADQSEEKLPQRSQG